MTKFTQTTIGGIIAALALSACAPGQPVEKAGFMYALGDGACGIIGAITHGSKGARNSALACGLVGAGVGSYMDHQGYKVRQQAEQEMLEKSNRAM